MPPAPCWRSLARRADGSPYSTPPGARALSAFDAEFVSQPLQKSRSLDDTLDRAWNVASRVPGQELSMVSPDPPCKPTTDPTDGIALRNPPSRAGRTRLLRRLDFAHRSVKTSVASASGTGARHAC